MSDIIILVQNKEGIKINKYNLKIYLKIDYIPKRIVCSS